MTGTHLISNRLNVAQVLAAAQTELLELLGDPSVKKVRRHRRRLARKPYSSRVLVPFPFSR